MEAVNERTHSSPTQCDLIMRHLKDYGEISQLDALREYGIMRLASRVSELRKRGVDIKVVMATGRNRYGEKTHYAIYELNKQEA